MFNSIARILTAGLLLVPVSAMAVPITVDFTVTGSSAFYSDGSSLAGYNGFPLGTTGTGWFTIDDSMGNYSSFTVGLTPIDFSFEWAGMSFNEANSVLWEVGFDGLGGFNYWGFSGSDGSCENINCVSSIGVRDFFVTGYGGPFVSNGETGVAVAHENNVAGWMQGPVTWSIRPQTEVPVPEPATLGLLSLGLLGVAATRRKRAAA